jgi:dienelactone hydrolase
VSENVEVREHSTRSNEHDELRGDEDEKRRTVSRHRWDDWRECVIPFDAVVKGGELFTKLDRTKLTEDLVAAAYWLKRCPESSGKLGATGFCFGGVANEGYVYPGAGHGFNNDATLERYNKAAAELAWQRTIGWFKKYLAT